MPSNIILYNSRYQHPVGQGFFHTGEISLGGKKLRYIYDCGSKHSDSLLSCINAYLAGTHDQKYLDVLFLSHLHEDHVNGLDALLGEIQVDTVVIPYLLPIERLAVLASTLYEYPLSASYVHLVSDPLRWFEDRGVKRIIQVKRGKGSTPKLPEFATPEMPLSSETLRIDFKKIPSNETYYSKGNSTEIMMMPHTIPLQIIADQIPINWTFLTFVHPIDKRVYKFKKAVISSFGAIPNDNKWLVNIVHDPTMRKKLYSCYSKTWPDLNVTSLSMYSGPFTLTPCFHTIKWYKFGLPQINEYPFVTSMHDNNRCAWLGTGDSDLFTDSRRYEFLKYFGPLANLVHTLALPHHGSKNNFHQELLDIGSPNCVISTGYMYGHPSQEVIRAVLHRNRHLVVVDQNPISMWQEEVALSVD
ncbi:MAG: hypothetical protein ABSA64_10760 [Sedimentisphaerales bacterium]|jgi:hypothetical protein